MLGTIMVANVFFVIIPAHWELVRAKQDGREPDPQWNAPRQAAVGAQQLLHAAGRLRMISGHFPFTYGHEHAWLILVVLMALGAWTRHYFNLRHKGGTSGGSSRARRPGSIVLAI